jgi:hypothetical protein
LRRKGIVRKGLVFLFLLRYFPLTDESETFIQYLSIIDGGQVNSHEEG